MVFGFIATTAVACYHFGTGLLAWLLGFAPIAKCSLVAWLMSIAWKTRVGIPIISFLQSAAAIFANML